MSDKELLELAAKSAGYAYSDLSFDGEDGLQIVGEYRKKNWNPLTDDGDALRLAVKLGIDIQFGFAATQINCDIYDWAEEAFKVGVHEDGRDDPYAATRRAIVRAAAEIGRTMG